MKVVLFCGGRGLRIRGHAGMVPKPMVHIGYRPILWHVMRYYAHFGHTDFILCLGHYGEVIRSYFSDHGDYLPYDFAPGSNGSSLQFIAPSAEDWTVTLVDTGKEACVGERLQAVRPFLEGEDVFLANYADCVTDLELPAMVDGFRERGAAAGFLSVKPFHSFHAVEASPDGSVQAIRRAAETGLRLNGGFFVLRREIFDYMEPGDELVEEPFQRLIREQKLVAHKHDGFWGCMDTFKDKKRLEEMHRGGKAPWEVWKTPDPKLERLEAGDAPEGKHPRLKRESSYTWGRTTFNGHWGEYKAPEAGNRS